MKDVDVPTVSKLLVQRKQLIAAAVRAEQWQNTEDFTEYQIDPRRNGTYCIGINFMMSGNDLTLLIKNQLVKIEKRLSLFNVEITE